MEPLTHFMTGACLGRAGFNRKAAYATLAMTVGAEAPDLDTLWSVNGPIAAFQHHRGITHTFVGLPFEAGVIVGAIYLIHRWRVRSAKAAPTPNPFPKDSETVSHSLTAAPVSWPLLYGFTSIALLSHILLDWTNNYGVRPFFPFNPRWYADSIVFIFEPTIFVALLLALIAPALFGLIGSEVGARRQHFRGQGWAIFALLSVLGIWGWRQVEHDVAIRTASTAAYGPIEGGATEVLRVTASPYPVNPYRWHTVAETPDFYQLATVDALHATVDTNPAQDILYKPPTTLATLLAKRSWLGEVYLDWSSWPVVTDLGPQPGEDKNGAPTAVSFRDLRFMYDTFFMDGRRSPPISATVYVDSDRRVMGMKMNSNRTK